MTVLGTGVRGDGPEADPLTCKLSRPHGVLAANGVLFVTTAKRIGYSSCVRRPRDRIVTKMSVHDVLLLQYETLD